jgi:thymidylate synthase
MFRAFDGKTADEVWQKISLAFRETAQSKPQDSRAGWTEEMLHIVFSISDPLQRWIPSRRPAVNPAFALAEVVWIVNGRNDAALPNYFNSRLPFFAGTGDTYHGAYGRRLRHHLQIDQLDRAYRVLKNNPDSRQVVLQIWDGRMDLPQDDGQASAEDVPCNVLSMLKVREGALEWTQVLRSNDLFRGLPHNIVQFTSLQEIMAGWLGLKTGTYNHLSDSLHVYNDTFDHINASIPTMVEPNVDSLTFPKEESESIFAELGRMADTIADHDTSADCLLKMGQQSCLPAPFRNIFLVLSAEGARRRARHDVAEEMMISCSNPAYRQLFHNWNARCNSSRERSVLSAGR